jgi:hypothetical protein
MRGEFVYSSYSDEPFVGILFHKGLCLAETCGKGFYGVRCQLHYGKYICICNSITLRSLFGGSEITHFACLLTFVA